MGINSNLFPYLRCFALESKKCDELSGEILLIQTLLQGYIDMRQLFRLAPTAKQGSCI